ncbi:YdeI/OmpD-associated family protein [Actinopolymorpha sp. B17G11]|uniref:YdeI/OmpD-associated family protein n=1 Tax=Actinopolymorpha sp. B17G11 TaxID=3160861 RepID=UPI0032E37E23
MNRNASVPPELPVLSFPTTVAFGAWLADHHETSAGLWLKIARKGSGGQSVTYAEAVDLALCHGWIDSQAKSFDDAHWLQRFTPRKPRSKWSKVNCDKVTRLIESGEMRPAGLREVERAKADGRWDAAYDSPRTATVPDDLQAALEREAVAREFFAGLDSRNRYAILHRIADAKKPETRARRIEKYVTMLASKEKLYP